MKVGIFTIVHALNYGAFFQMYAMYRFFLEQGHDVTVFDCEKSIKHKLIRNLARDPKKLIFKRKLVAGYKKDLNEVNIAKYRGEQLDLAILGSDEIWNVDNSSFFHSPEFFGIGVDAKKIIACAPSMGFCEPSSILNSPTLVEAISKLDFHFPRDTNTKELMEKICDESVSITEIVDPTIFYNRWERFKNTSDKRDQIVYYSYDANPPFKDELIKFAKDNNLVIVSAGFQCSWADKNINCGPFDFLDLLSSSKYVITTTFHGTIMSALLDCNFITIPNGQKAINLVDKFNLECNVLNKDKNISDVYKSNRGVTSSFKFTKLSNSVGQLICGAINE